MTNNFKIGDVVYTLNDIKTTRNNRPVLVSKGTFGTICDINYDQFVIIETNDINGDFILLSVKPDLIKIK